MPEVGVYHPRLEGRITTDATQLPKPENAVGTVGLLRQRHVLAKDTTFMMRSSLNCEGKACRCTAFAGGFDGRP